MYQNHSGVATPRVTALAGMRPHADTQNHRHYEYLEVPIPEPRPGEVLILAHAIGFGMPDCLIRAGTYSVMPPLPATPGTELAGVIEKVGPGVTTLPHLFLPDCRVELALHWPNARGKRLPPGVQAVSVPRLSSIQIFI